MDAHQVSSTFPTSSLPQAIEQRLTATLKRIRARRGESDHTLRSLGRFDDDDKDLSYADNANPPSADLISKRQAIRAGIFHLKKEELVRIEAVVPDVALVMAGDEDRADAAAASLHAEMPWMARATEHAWHALRRAARRGVACVHAPVHPERTAGIGKSVWGAQAGANDRTTHVDIDSSKGSAGFAVAGLERGWVRHFPDAHSISSCPTRVANRSSSSTSLQGETARSDKGNNFSFADALLSLIEPATAANWECNYFRLRFDMSHILWVMTANDVHLTRSPCAAGAR